MTQCCVKGCKSNSRKNDPEISFHRLPRNLKTRAKWIKNIGRTNWNPTPNTYICSLHFEKNGINHTLKVPRVKDNCFPTIFPQGMVRHRNVQNELNTNGCLSQQHVMGLDLDESNSQASTSTECPLQLQRKVLSATTYNIKWDHSYASSSTRQVSIIQKMTKKIKTQQKQIKRLKEKVKRQSNRIFKLQSVLTTLKNKNYQ